MRASEANELANWAKAESAKLAPDSLPGSLLESDVLESWKVHRPRMWAAMKARGAVEALAHVLVDRALKSETAYLNAGMPPTDAREEAEKDWLLREPEEGDEKEQEVVKPARNGTPSRREVIADPVMRGDEEIIRPDQLLEAMAGAKAEKANFLPPSFVALMPAAYGWQLYGSAIGLAVYVFIYCALVLLGWTYLFREWPVRRLKIARILLVVSAMGVIGLSAMETCDVQAQVCSRVFWSK